MRGGFSVGFWFVGAAGGRAISCYRVVVAILVFAFVGFFGFRFGIFGLLCFSSFLLIGSFLLLAVLDVGFEMCILDGLTAVLAFGCTGTVSSFGLGVVVRTDAGR